MRLLRRLPRGRGALMPMGVNALQRSYRERQWGENSGVTQPLCWKNPEKTAFISNISLKDECSAEEQEQQDKTCM